MLRKSIAGGAALAITALLTVAAVSPAAARIECRGNFQVTQYGNSWSCSSLSARSSCFGAAHP